MCVPSTTSPLMPLHLVNIFRRPPLCQSHHAPLHGYRLTAMTSCPWDQISKIVSNNPNCPLLHSLCQQARSLRGGQVNVTICGAVHGKFKRRARDKFRKIWVRDRVWYLGRRGPCCYASAKVSNPGSAGNPCKPLASPCKPLVNPTYALYTHNLPCKGHTCPLYGFFTFADDREDLLYNLRYDTATLHLHITRLSSTVSMLEMTLGYNWNYRGM